MADKIVKIEKEIKNSDSTIEQWDISYAVEDADDKNLFVITVNGDDMVDRTDQVEAESLANTKAAAVKAAWVNTKTDTSSPALVSASEKTVTL